MALKHHYRIYSVELNSKLNSDIILEEGRATWPDELQCHMPDVVRTSSLAESHTIPVNYEIKV